jgi:3-methyl-2-oxobutanoate hydroxymethyltransferase
LGLNKNKPAKFVRQYADLGGLITEAVSKYAQDVRNASFPSADETYANPAELTD